MVEFCPVSTMNFRGTKTQSSKIEASKLIPLFSHNKINQDLVTWEMNDSADHCVVFLSLTCLHLWTSVHSWTQSYKFRDNTFFLLSYKETGWFWIQTYTLLPPGFKFNDIRINDRRHLPPPGTRSTGCQASSKELLSELLLLVASVGWKSSPTPPDTTTRWHLRSGEKYEWSQKCHQNKTSPLDQARSSSWPCFSQ